MFFMAEEDFYVNGKQLIQEVRQRPILYNSLAVNYYNRAAREEKWEEIFQILVTDWNNLTEEQRNNHGSFIRRKWRSIRDAFTKDYRKRKNLSERARLKSKPYIYSSILSFLIPTLHKRPRNALGSANNEENSEESNLQIEMSSSSVPALIYDDNSKNDDEDQLFLMSLLPLYKAMREDSKLISRIKMLELLRGVILDGSSSSSKSFQNTNKQAAEDVVFNLEIQNADDVKNEPPSPVELIEEDLDPLSLISESPPPKKPRIVPTSRQNTPTSTTSSSAIVIKQVPQSPINASEDIFEAIGKNVAYKLRSMVQQQRIIAEKIVGDVMYHGQMESLTVDSHLAL